MRMQAAVCVFVFCLAISNLSQAQQVFDDDFVNGWLGWYGETGSWNVDVIDWVGNSHSGSRSIYVAYLGSWAGYLIEHPTGGVSTSGSNVLRLALERYPDGTSNTLYVKLHHQGPLGGYVNMADYTGGSIPQDQWILVDIPLADLGGSNTTVSAIEIQSALPAQFWFDTISFASVSLPDPGMAYSDSILWNNGSWNATINASHGNSYQGSYSIQVQTTSTWGALYLYKSGCLNTSGYNTLRFALNGGSSGGQNIVAALTDSSGNPLYLMDLSQYVEGGSIPANQWRYVIIPLEELNADNTNVCGVFIQAENPTTFLVDELEISTQSGSSEWNPSNDPPHPVVYSDAEGAGWSGLEWGDIVANFSSSEQAWLGSKSVKAIFNSTWNTVGFNSPVGFNTAGYPILKFAVYPTGGNEDLHVFLLNETGGVIGQQGFITNIGRLTANLWHTLTIPLSNLNADSTIVHSVIFQTAEAASPMYFDDVRFSPEIPPAANQCLLPGGTKATTSWTPSGPQCIPSQVNLFKDSLPGEVSLWYWLATTAETTSGVYKGSKAVEVNTTSNNGGVQFYSAIAYDPGRFAITFAIKGTQSGQDLSVHAVTGNGQLITPPAPVNVSDYIVEGSLQPDYRVIWIPFSHLMNFTPSTGISGFSLTANIPGVFYLDEVKLMERFKMPLPGGKNWLLTVEAGGGAFDGIDDPFHYPENAYFSLDFSARTIENGGAPESNVPILAAATGRVAIAECGHAFNGCYVVLDHDLDGNENTGFSTWYVHLVSTPSVTPGQLVNRGKKLGIMGNTGESEGIHLHLGFKYDGKRTSDTHELKFVEIEDLKIEDYQVGGPSQSNWIYYPSTNSSGIE